MTEENVEQEMSEGFDKYVLCNKDVSQTDQQHFLLYYTYWNIGSEEKD